MATATTAPQNMTFEQAALLIYWRNSIRRLDSALLQNGDAELAFGNPEALIKVARLSTKARKLFGHNETANDAMLHAGEFHHSATFKAARHAAPYEKWPDEHGNDFHTYPVTQIQKTCRP